MNLLMVYAGIMAHGINLTAAECARMIPQLSATSIRQAMRWASDERRLSQACQAVLESMQRHPIAATLGAFRPGFFGHDEHGDHQTLVASQARSSAQHALCRYLPPCARSPGIFLRAAVRAQ